MHTLNAYPGVQEHASASGQAAPAPTPAPLASDSPFAAQSGPSPPAAAQQLAEQVQALQSQVSSMYHFSMGQTAVLALLVLLASPGTAGVQMVATLIMAAAGGLVFLYQFRPGQQRPARPAIRSAAAAGAAAASGAGSAGAAVANGGARAPGAVGLRFDLIAEVDASTTSSGSSTEMLAKKLSLRPRGSVGSRRNSLQSRLSMHGSRGGSFLEQAGTRHAGFFSADAGGLRPGGASAGRLPLHAVHGLPLHAEHGLPLHAVHGLPLQCCLLGGMSARPRLEATAGLVMPAMSQLKPSTLPPRPPLPPPDTPVHPLPRFPCNPALQPAWSQQLRRLRLCRWRRRFTDGSCTSWSRQPAWPRSRRW